MNNRIHQLIEQITVLEDELKAQIDARECQLRYRIEGRRVVFEQNIREAHQHFRQNLFHWFLSVRPQNYLTMPIIYGMCVPLMLFDLCVSLYQTLCFPIYRIAHVRRSDYIIFDHQHLAYLNIIEKAHCLYCSYGVGVLGYAQEIIARTEQYFCPIKHAHKLRTAHTRYADFIEYGEADDFHVKLEALRTRLAAEKASQTEEHDSL